MGRRRRRRNHWLAPAALIVGAVICFFAYELTALSFFAPRREVSPIVSSARLRLMSPFGPAFAGAMVAERAGLFQSEGIHIDLEAGQDADDPISSVTKGSDTFGITRADTFLLARGKGARIVAFAAGLIDSPAVFFVLQKSKLRVPQDFSGHRVGRRNGDDTAMVYDALVTKLGLPQSTISEVPVDDDLSMLLRGDVDAWPGHIGDEDYALERKNADYAVISPTNYGVDPLGTVYFASEQTIAKQPQLIRRFLAGLIAGWDLTYKDSVTSIPMIVSFDEQRLSADYVRFALDRQRELLRPMAVRYGEFNEDQWRALQRMLLSQRRLQRSVDLQEAVTSDFLHDVYRRPLAFGE